MWNHILELAEAAVAQASTVGRRQELAVTIPALVAEITRLDTGDFEPAVRVEFALDRVRLQQAQSTTGTVDTRDLEPLLRKVRDHLDGYRGLRSAGTYRPCPWMHDVRLASIVGRDYAELARIVLPAGAWKSSVVLAGSIVEAALFDVLSNPVRIAVAIASHKVPTAKRTASSLQNGDWRLAELIEVATDLALIDLRRAKTFDQILRDYRNFVHPKVELRAQHPCTEAEALMSKGALDALLTHFDATL